MTWRVRVLSERKGEGRVRLQGARNRALDGWRNEVSLATSCVVVSDRVSVARTRGLVTANTGTLERGRRDPWARCVLNSGHRRAGAGVPESETPWREFRVGAHLPSVDCATTFPVHGVNGDRIRAICGTSPTGAYTETGCSLANGPTGQGYYLNADRPVVAIAATYAHEVVHTVFGGMEFEWLAQVVAANFVNDLPKGQRDAAKAAGAGKIRVAFPLVQP